MLVIPASKTLARHKHTGTLHTHTHTPKSTCTHPIIFLSRVPLSCLVDYCHRRHTYTCGCTGVTSRSSHRTSVALGSRHPTLCEPRWSALRRDTDIALLVGRLRVCASLERRTSSSRPLNERELLMRERLKGGIERPTGLSRGRWTSAPRYRPNARGCSAGDSPQEASTGAAIKKLVLYLHQKIDEAIESTVAQVACNFREVFPKLAPKSEGGACRAVRQEG